MEGGDETRRLAGALTRAAPAPVTWPPQSSSAGVCGGRHEGGARSRPQRGSGAPPSRDRRTRFDQQHPRAPPLFAAVRAVRGVCVRCGALSCGLGCAASAARGASPGPAGRVRPACNPRALPCCFCDKCAAHPGALCGSGADRVLEGSEIPRKFYRRRRHAGRASPSAGNIFLLDC